MFKTILKLVFVNTVSLLTVFGALVFLAGFLNDWKVPKYLLHPSILIIAISVYVTVVFLRTSYQLTGELRSQHQTVLGQLQERLHAERIQLQNEADEALRAKKVAERDTQIWKTSLLERSAGFPTLVKIITEYEQLRDESLANRLITKSHPAKRAAEIVKEEAARRRAAESQAKTVQAVIDYYEYIAPFLVDCKNDIVDAKPDEIVFGKYNEEERQDPVIHYLTKEEYRQLPTAERNQLALDRFWKRPNKSKRLLGRLYERYVGYLYERDGYEVEYIGIVKGYEDLGRDLICRKGEDFIIIQCKNWSQFKTIYEKHIFQFFGTVFQYKDENPGRKVRAIFYTTTHLSDLARRFAHELGIELKENFKFDSSYPCIKGNINVSSKEKIYHLPFDQQYDNTKIINPGEIYCSTVQEAEDQGFRRALRWRSSVESAKRTPL